jgi:hypothetical protein
MPPDTGGSQSLGGKFITSAYVLSYHAELIEMNRAGGRRKGSHKFSKIPYEDPLCKSIQG